MEETNIFKVLGVSTKEDVLTNLLEYCFNTSRQFSSLFFNSILKWPATTQFDGVHVRKNVPGYGTPDMIISGRRTDTPRVALIELKLHAIEGLDQTDRYAQSECQSAILAQLDFPPNTEFHLIFLTLFPDQKPNSHRFRATSFRPILRALQKTPVSDDRLGSQLLSDWTECLDEFYAAGSLHNEDALTTKLSSNVPGAGFLAFNAFAASIKPAICDSYKSDRSSPQGRPFYLVKFSKSTWHPLALLQDEWRNFDPSKHFDIHLECQFHLRTKKLNVYIHYETNPYKPNLGSNISAQRLADHLRRRREFKAALSGLLSDQFVPASNDRVNQIARAPIPLEELTVSDARKQVKRLLSSSADAIDKALLKSRTGRTNP
ncbi:MAG TPA: hypothetical protein VGD59_00010 [Acidisarcina sp.]